MLVRLMGPLICPPKQAQTVNSVVRGKLLHSTYCIRTATAALRPVFSVYSLSITSHRAITQRNLESPQPTADLTDFCRQDEQNVRTK